ncbi:MAG: pyridoxamine 5'-phosphate oxidase family protein [Bryobacterales bacterium]|nr:pyridoxamine 5'-phosphate oxidase family protein [Bryobacterales bacterium]
MAEPQAARPRFIKGYGIREDRAGLLPWSYVDQRMSASRNYWIATTRPGGRPHAMPVWGVWLDGRLYFSTDHDSLKSRNLRGNPAVAVHLESGDDVVILEGAAQLAGGNDLTAFDDAYSAKYGIRVVGAIPGAVVYAVTPTLVLAWREKDFTESATSWRFPQAPRPE